MKRLRKAIAEEIETHLWPDPVAAILSDLAVLLLVVFGVMLVAYLARR